MLFSIPNRTIARCLLAVLTLFFSQVCLSSESEQWQDKEAQQKQLEELKRNISKLKTWIDSAHGRQTELEKDLRIAEKEIQKKVRQTDKLQKDLRKTQKQIKNLEKQEREHLQALRQQQELLGQQVRTAYAMGREQGVKLLLNAEDPLTLQRLMSYYGYLNEARGQQIENYRGTIDELKKTRNEILVQNQKLITSRNELTTTRKDLEGKRRQRSVALARLNKNLNSKQNQLVRMERDQKQLEDLVKEVERTISNLELTHDSMPFIKLRGKLKWPANGALLRNFGTGGSQFRSPGVFFKVPVNDPVNAVHHGRVVFADWLRGFGLLMIIDHGDNYMSLYGFNQALLKDTGDWVKSGETIASAGNSGGQTQSGLYFEIRHKGKPSNPVRWLQKKRSK